MRLSAPTVRAGVSWDTGTSAAGGYQRDIAPRKTEWFECPDGHRFALVFALGAEVPSTWDCPRCGKTAQREGAPEGTEGRPELPGLTSGTGRHHRSHLSEGTSPREQLEKNLAQRKPGYAKAALAEALERARKARAAE